MLVKTEKMDKRFINRRKFIKKSARYSAYGALGFILPGVFKGTAEAGRLPDIVVANGTPGASVRAAVNALGGMDYFVKSGDRVVIKPNMSFPNPPAWATTTHPEVVWELASMCLQAGASSVVVLDNPLRNTELCLERSGIRRALDSLPGSRTEGIESERFFQEVKIPKAIELSSTMIMKQVLEADVLIAAPVAKSHSATGLSLSMKGMMGLIYNRSDLHLNMDLNTAVVDLCTALKPQLTVIDVSRLLTSGGPGGPGKVITMNKIVASTDMVAADAATVQLGTWYGRKFKARQVKHIRMAHERGLGNMDIDRLVVKEINAS
jgi:uncharacterized protein (DUF362 family)